MAKKVLSIVIGSEYTKVCEVTYPTYLKSRGIRICQSISFPTPENAVEDGYIKDKNTFGEELKKRLGEVGIKTDKVIFSIASSKIANREVHIPPSKEKRIMDILRMGAGDYFPVDMKDYSLSYYILEKNASDQIKNKSFRNWKDIRTQLFFYLSKLRTLLKQKGLQNKNKTDYIVDKIQSENNPKDMQDKQKPVKKPKAKKYMRLMVYAVPSTLVKNYYSFSSLMHFDIISMDYIGNSNYQLLKYQKYHGTNVFIQINEQDTLVSILRDDVLILQRNVGYGISALADAVMDQKCFGVNSKEEAFKLLKDRNLLLPDQEEYSKHSDMAFSAVKEAAAGEETAEADRIQEEEKKEAFKSVIMSLYFLTNSLTRLLDYYKSSHVNTDIDSVYIYGPGMNIQGMNQYLSSVIGLPIKKIDKFSIISSRRTTADFRNDPGNYLSCIGAVIKPVNFIPIEFIIKKQKRSLLLATVFFTMVCLCGSLGMIFVSLSDYRTASNELINVKKEDNSLPKLKGIKKEYNTSLEELINLKLYEVSTGSKNDNITKIMNEMEKKLPSDIAVQSLQFSASGLSMNVMLTSRDANPNKEIAKMLLQLKSIEYFGMVDVSGVSKTKKTGIQKATFSVTCTYK